MSGRKTCYLQTMWFDCNLSKGSPCQYVKGFFIAMTRHKPKSGIRPTSKQIILMTELGLCIFRYLLKTAAKVHILFLTGSFSYLNPVTTFVKLPISDVKPTLQVVCSQVFPWLWTNEFSILNFQLSILNSGVKLLLCRCLCTLYHIRFPSFSLLERENDGKTIE